MTAWSQPHTVKSNARRAARKAGVDPASVVSFVKAGETLYRYPDVAKGAAQMKKVQAATQARVKKAVAERTASKKARTPKPKAAKVATPQTAETSAPKPARGGGRFHQVLALLRQPGGAAMSTITNATGWKPHSARARISVDVSKLLDKGEQIERYRDQGESYYRIAKSTQQDLPLPEPKAA